MKDPVLRERTMKVGKRNRWPEEKLLSRKKKKEYDKSGRNRRKFEGRLRPGRRMKGTEKGCLEGKQRYFTGLARS